MIVDKRIICRSVRSVSFYRWCAFEKEVYCHTWEVYGALLIEERRLDALSICL
ncbi:hypothetical protein J5S49_00285 [Virgibacillus halodenitrificans]|nr:hypothetical protein [Virgibacillus halodenitrificans]